MRTLILGGRGMLGQAVLARVRRSGSAALALSHRQADITDPSTLCYWADTFRPQLIVNCAALTRVDDCETEVDEAMQVNGEAVANVVAMAARVEARLIQVSTDYVFDGSGTKPYREQDETGPRSVYGRSKLLGESHALAYERSLVVRVSWLFGPGGGNFVATMLRLIRQGHRHLRVVDDQVGAPTYTGYLAAALLQLAETPTSGLLHYRNREAVSWYDFTREIVRQWDPTVEVEPVSTEAFPRPAPRPEFSVLDIETCQRALGRPVEAWSAGLAEYLAEFRRGTHL
ncbi:MAG: dTDP-4-dehydrorhamnose reductase [Deltaproteobacteria bacterium]|nr:dTDP-4-dehydrorhamnose reductase [Deltaproteobacteria bacterium]